MDMSVGLLLLKMIAVLSVSRKVSAFVHTCDFETGETLCGYVQDTNDDFDWRIRQGETPTSDTGPSYDHTLGFNSTGHYMYIEASGPGTWDLARIVSPTMPATSSFCLRLYYHMSGADTGRLSVRLRSTSGDEGAREEPLWSIRGDQGGEWIEATVDGSSTSDFEVLFEANRGEGFKSDIAIDDITLAAGTTCGGQLITPPHVTSDWMPNPSIKMPEPIREQDTVPKTAEEVTLVPRLPIDRQLVIIILAVGLSFWGVVFALIAAVLYKSSQSQHRKDYAEYDVIAEPTNQEFIALSSIEKQDREQSFV